MVEHSASSALELHRILAKYRTDRRWLFRGQSRLSWKLVPKAGRPPYDWVDDLQVFKAWKRHAIAFLPQGWMSDWEWLAVAQEHGLATRLLDWSRNPLAAAYFAVAEDDECDAVVYAARFKMRVDVDKVSPMEYGRVARFNPPDVVPRIVRQRGVFSVHGQPKTPLEEEADKLDGLERIVIPSAYRHELQCELDFYGINAATLFPDLDGLSRFANWSLESREYWKRLAPNEEENDGDATRER